MEHIGTLIRNMRIKQGLSAEKLGQALNKPISKQAFSKKERTGRFSFELVQEIADILGCDMTVFLPRKSTKNSQTAKCQDEQAATTDREAG